MSRVLRERREDIRKEIKEIAQITRIKASYLKFIEDEEYEKLPVEVYTKGYIREYAEYLEIPYNVAVSPYERYMESKMNTKSKEHHVDPLHTSVLPGELADEPEQNIKKTAAVERDDSKAGSGENILKNLLSNKNIWILPVIIIIAVVLLVILQQPGRPPSPQKTDAPVSAPVSPPQPAQQDKADEAAPRTPVDVNIPDAVKPKPRPEETVRPEAPAAVKNQPAVANEKPRKHNLNITATDESWVQVTIDGSEIRSVLLRPGEKISYGANKTFSLKVGNAAGVVLNFDGREIKNLGMEREVVTLNLPSLPSEQPSDVNSSSGTSNQ